MAPRSNNDPEDRHRIQNMHQDYDTRDHSRPPLPAPFLSLRAVLQD